MTYNSEADPFHQEVQFEIIPPRKLSGGELNTAMKSIGMKLNYDVYSMPRQEEVPNWQSLSYAHVDLLLDGERSDAQDGCDHVFISYPLATIDSAYIPRFGEMMIALSMALRGHVKFMGQDIDRDGIIDELNRQSSEILETWGEEPGSEQLRIFIETNN